MRLHSRFRPLLGLLRGPVARLRREDGISLLMVMGFVLIFSITTTAIVSEVTSNEKSAGRDDNSSAVFNLAEAALNFGIDQVNTFDGAAGTAGDGTCYPSTNCSVWTAYTGLPGLSSAEQPEWYAQKIAGVWTVHARATRGSTTRELAVKLQRGSDPQSPDLDAWQGAYSYNQPGTCIELSNGVTIAEDIYTSGDLCLAPTADIVDSTPGPEGVTTLYVGGYLWLKTGYAGTSTNPLRSATILGNCYTGVSSQVPLDFPRDCKDSLNSHVNAMPGSIYVTDVAAPTPVPKPPVDLSWYRKAAPRPDWYPCPAFPGTDSNSMRDNGLPGLPPNVELFGSTPYSCTTPAGSITWTPSTSHLTIDGVVFVDGNLLVPRTTNNLRVVYSGRGTIYFNGTIHLNGENFQLCPTPTCVAPWYPDTSLLLLVALNNTQDGLPMGSPIYPDDYTFTIEGNNAIFQGAAYAIGGFLTSNKGRIEGPVISDGLIYQNKVESNFTALGGKGLPGGAPTTPNAWLSEAGSWRQVR